MDPEVPRTKRCYKCGETKSLSEFYRDASRKDGLSPRCKACTIAHSKSYYDDHREEQIARVKAYQKEYPERVRVYQRAHRLRRRHGLTQDEYSDLLEAQGGCCVICGETPEEADRPLVVDHNHETGEIRGLLCSNCNVGVGMFRDDPKLCELAMKYLQHFQ